MFITTLYKCCLHRNGYIHEKIDLTGHFFEWQVIHRDTGHTYHAGTAKTLLGAKRKITRNIAPTR